MTKSHSHPNRNRKSKWHLGGRAATTYSPSKWGLGAFFGLATKEVEMQRGQRPIAFDFVGATSLQNFSMINAEESLTPRYESRPGVPCLIGAKRRELQCSGHDFGGLPSCHIAIVVDRPQHPVRVRSQFG